MTTSQMTLKILTNKYFQIFILVLALLIPQVSASYTYIRPLYLNQSMIVGNQTDFPILISGTYSYLANTAQSGGNVSHLSGYDIGFYSFYTCDQSYKLSWEIESYNSTTGNIVAWIKIPFLPNTTQTKIYMCYGDSSLTTDLSNASAVWSNNFSGVWHLSDSSGTTITESTSNPNNGSKKSATEPRFNSSGKIGSGQTFDGYDDYIVISDHDSLDSSENITISGWMKSSAFDYPYAYQIIDKEGNYYLRTSTSGANYEIGWWNGADITRNTAVSPNLNTWHYFVGTATNNYASLIFINGTSSGAGPNTWFGDARRFTDPVYIGGFPLDYAVNGTLDEIRVSLIVRNETWIITEYNNQQDPASFFIMGAENDEAITKVVEIRGQQSSIYGINTVIRQVIR